jgi:hypothetical protein
LTDVTSPQAEAEPIPSPEALEKAQAEAARRDEAEQKELDSLRDRLGADEIKVADVLSTTVRTVATGLTLITYTFLTADKPSPFVTAHFHAMRLASVLGLSALVTDALHYGAALLQIQRTRTKILAQDGRVTVDFVVAARTNLFYYARNAFFLIKIALVACGSAVVITALLSTQLENLTKT